MNENTTKLVKALRSGEYEQAHGVLRLRDAFCCLGVACDISGVGEWDVSDHYVTESARGYALLPSEVIDWLGWNSDSGLYRGSSLSRDNDMGATFNQIADNIEHHYPELVL